MAIRFAPSRPGAGFEAGGVLDESAPSASLAGRADAATRTNRLAELDDDELIGLMRAWRRLESWCDAGLLATIAELARRRPAERTAPAPPGQIPAQVSEFASDEVAAALTLSAQTAGTYSDLALDLATRLPATFHALHHGIIDHLKARVIAEATRVLTDDQAREVEARIFPRAGQQTSGQLRAAVARAVQAVDPEAAARRRAEAQKDPRVSRWQEDAGTAALAGFGLPPAEVLEADQRITGRALALRAAGLPGSLGQLRARAYLDALLGQDSTPTPPAPPASPASAAPADPPPPAGPSGSPSPTGSATPPTSPRLGPASRLQPRPGSPTPAGRPAQPHRPAERFDRAGRGAGPGRRLRLRRPGSGPATGRRRVRSPGVALLRDRHRRRRPGHRPRLRSRLRRTGTLVHPGLHADDQPTGPGYLRSPSPGGRLPAQPPAPAPDQRSHHDVLRPRLPPPRRPLRPRPHHPL